MSHASTRAGLLAPLHLLFAGLSEIGVGLGSKPHHFSLQHAWMINPLLRRVCGGTRLGSGEGHIGAYSRLAAGYLHLQEGDV